ncbi:MAG: carbohydrate-binding family 9-like protein, partial [Bacteroidales bacterium]|nr:carbohydrate-binding family 9-like protein [Bacteroidales bacterium]
AKMLWDDEYLYIGAYLEEPQVWAQLSQRDTVIYHDPDFEIFIDPDCDGVNYFEIESNAREVIFDLFLQKPYRARERAFVTFSWDCPGLLLKTHVDGTINDCRDEDRGWSIEVAIPRKAIAAEFDNCLQAGNYLRLGMSRVEWQIDLKPDGSVVRRCGEDGKRLPEDNWTWPSTGMIAFHMPERWGYVLLSDTHVKEFTYPETRPVERLLWAMFYEQEQHRDCYLTRLESFNLPEEELARLPEGSRIEIEGGRFQYLIRVVLPDGNSLSINQDGYLCRRAAK